MGPSKLAILVANAWALRHGCTPLSYETPDEIDRHSPAVDLLGRDAGGRARLVLEHTLVESFLDQRSVQIAAGAMFGPLEQELSGHLPGPGHYRLTLRPASVLGLKSESGRIRAWVADWIRETAPTLTLGGPGQGPRHFATVALPNTALEVSLYRWPKNDGEFRLVFDAPAQAEDVLSPSLKRAVDAKCPKLSATKAENLGAISLLLLEVNDIALGNLFDLDAVVQAWLAGLPELAPDDIWLADTTSAAPSIMVAKTGEHLGDGLQDRLLPFRLREGASG